MRNRLRGLRSERFWSQAEVARRLGVSRQTVNAVETGRCDPGLELAFRIARLFGRSVEGVFEPDADFSQGDGAR
jgi:putative transcriptional regulator